MPDPLTPAERQAIASYTGPINRIPTGVTGLQPAWEAIPLRQQINTSYKHAAAMRAIMIRRRDDERGYVPPMQILDGETTTQTVMRLRAEKRSTREIAGFLTLTSAGVHYHVRKAAKMEAGN